MAITATRPVVDVRSITDADLRVVGEFLQANLNARVPVDDWVHALDSPWSDRPNAGVMLLDGEQLVGVHLAFYSERLIDGRLERFCNLGAWCVLPEYRFHAVKLLKALLAQDGYHFTDLSPSGNVVGINTRLGFRSLDTTISLVPNLPWPSWPGRAVISSDRAVIERTLTGRDLALYRDHATARGARHLVLKRGDEWCYVVFRKDRRKKLPLFASILHVSNPGLYREMARPLGRHLLLRHGVAATLAEDRVVKQRPRLSFRLHNPRPKMFLSPDLEPDQVDYFYSELVRLAW